MEDCCSKDKNSEDILESKEEGGKIKMDIKRVILWIIIAILVIAVIYVLFLRGSTSGGVASSAGQVVRQASGGMVGGC